MNSRFNTALYWHSLNVSVVPLYYRSKKPHAEALISSGLIKADGQATWLPLKTQVPTIEQISQWFGNGSKKNLALVTTDKLIAIDFDTPQAYALWFCWQLEHNPVVIDTYTVISARGIHCYYWLDNPLDNPIRSQEPYEIKSHGRLINIPPSIHPCGTRYKAVNHPDKILSVVDINELLTFSPVKFERPVIRNDDPWQISHSLPTEKINLLELFPDAKQTNTDGYYLTDCPFHGHRNNFMLNVNDDVAFCYAGCGSFLATELYRMLGE